MTLLDTFFFIKENKEMQEDKLILDCTYWYYL